MNDTGTPACATNLHIHLADPSARLCAGEDLLLVEQTRHRLQADLRCGSARWQEGIGQRTAGIEEDDADRLAWRESRPGMHVALRFKSASIAAGVSGPRGLAGEGALHGAGARWR